nr:PD-(D/E)XK nuclease family protein [uncultured Peptostreptococcus sp.]
MGVGFIKGRINSDRSKIILDLCFKEAKSGSKGPILILVPEKYTFEMEKKLSLRLLEDKDPDLRIRVVSMSTLANMVFTKVGGLKEKKISSSARGMLIYKSIESVSKELNTLKMPQDSTGLVDIVKDMLIELKQNKIGLSDLENMASKTRDEALKYKLEDIGKIYSSYEKLIDEKYIDTEDWVKLLSKKLGLYEDIREANIFIDEFTGFTPVQYDLIESLISTSKNTYISLILDPYSKLEKSTVFTKTHITFTSIIDICNKYNLKRLEDINLGGQNYYLSDDLAYLEKNINLYKPKPYNKPVDKISIFEFENIYKEVEYVASKIVDLVHNHGYRYKEITVATRDIEAYSYLVRAIFKDYKISYFLDQKLEAKTNSIIILLTSILNMKKENYSYKSVFTYLKSGLVGIGHEDISLLENYVIANGIRGIKWFKDWDKQIIHNIDDEQDQDISGINTIRQRVIAPIQKLHDRLKGKNTVRDISSYLYDFAIDINLAERVNDLVENFKSEENHYKAREYSQVWNIFIDLLDEMVEFLGDEKIGLDRYIRLMEAELAGLELGIIPPSSDQVFVTSVDRMKNPDTKVLLLMGVNEGVFPKTIGDQTLINDREKEKLAGIGVRFDSNIILKTFDELFLVYKAMGLAREGLIITYPIADFEGKALRISSLVKKIMKIFPNLCPVNFLETSQETMYDHLLCDDKKSNTSHTLGDSSKYDNRVFKLDIDLIEDLYGRGVFSVSKLEKYASCPFSYFVDYGLRAKERPINEFNSMDSGIYCHKILDDFSKFLVKKSVSWLDLDKTYIEGAVNSISNDLIRSRLGYILDSSEKYRYLYSRLNKSLIDAIDNMSKQVEKGDFQPRGFELSFGFDSIYPPLKLSLDNGRKVDIIGKIDRLDTCIDGDREFVRIIDYKSSGKDIDLTSLYGGLQLQLFMYMNAVLNADTKNKLEPAAILYSNLANNDIKLGGLGEGMLMSDEDIDLKLLQENKFSGLIVNESDIIGHMDRDLGPGKSSDIMKVKLRSDGLVQENVTTSMSAKEFDIVRKFVINKSKEICRDIYGGKIEISPYKIGDFTGCTYCQYKAICQFDPSSKINEYRIIQIPFETEENKSSDRLDNDDKTNKRGKGLGKGRYSHIVKILANEIKKGDDN